MSDTNFAQGLEALRKQKNELDRQIKSQASTLFHENVKHVFEAHPDLVAFAWTQYTPYFNDGEPCEFNSHHRDPEIQFGDETETEEFYFNEDGKYEKQPNGKYGYTPHTPETIAKLEPKVKADKAVNDFLRNFTEEEFEFMFGDHTKVTVTRNGVEQDDYDHD